MSTIKPKIAVLMWWDDTIKDYAINNYEINKLYCNRHGYDLIYSNKRTYLDRPPHWERIPLALEHLPNYDYIVWIDADAHFYIDAQPIESIINYYSHLDCIFSGDYQQSFAYEINSGVFILKNCHENELLLNYWGYSERLFNFRYPPFNDQGALQLLYNENYRNIRNRSIVVPYGILQEFDLTYAWIRSKPRHERKSRKKQNINSESLSSTPKIEVPLFKVDKPFILHLAGAPMSARIEESINYLKSIKF